MKKAILEKTALILFISASTVSANGKDIVLIDDTEKSSKVQKKIIGCDDTAKKGALKCSKSRTAEDRDRDIKKLEKKLNDILQQIAEIKKENNSNTQNNKIAKIKDSIKKLTGESKLKSASKNTIKEVKVIAIESDHVVIEVQSGECLSKYAQKYYGDSSKYQKIYRANRDKIGKDLQVFIGDRLIIPTSDSYIY